MSKLVDDLGLNGEKSSIDYEKLEHMTLSKLASIVDSKSMKVENVIEASRIIMDFLGSFNTSHICEHA